MEGRLCCGDGGGSSADEARCMLGGGETNLALFLIGDIGGLLGMTIRLSDHEDRCIVARCCGDEEKG
jgi:hypothetical protein